MVYFKLEFGFGKSKKQKVNPSTEVKEMRGWDFVSSQVETLKTEGRFKTASNYLTAARSWSKFVGHNNWYFSEMDGKLTERYQRWLCDQGICLNTVSAYLRALRAMYNRTVDRNLSDSNGHPFAKVFTGRARTAKRSVTAEVIRQLHELQLPEGSALAISRDIFIFSFYAMGMPFVDIAYLKKHQMRDGFIRYARHKTGQQICVAVTSVMLDIVNRYHEANSEYVFPFLSEQSPELLHKQYLLRLRQYNYYLHVLSSMISSPHPLSSYVVRHSWASIAYQHHIDIGLIGKALGHTKTSTTLLYIKSLFDSDLATANQSLMQELGLTRT